MLVCLNKETFELHKHRLTPESVVVYDADQYEVDADCIKVGIPFRKIKHEMKAQQIMVNTVALAASLTLLGGDIERYRQMIRDEFSRKGDAVVDFNLKLVDMGQQHIMEHYREHIRPVLTPRESEPQLILTGNDAFFPWAA
jgi:2-oxoglutarate ferredoxin oxidoreductase subunit alpha